MRVPRAILPLPLVVVFIGCESAMSTTSAELEDTQSQTLVAHRTAGLPLLASTAPESAFEVEVVDGESCTTVTFEGVADQSPVGSVDAMPGVQFGDAWLGIVSYAAGGLGPFAHNPSGVTGAFQPEEGDATIRLEPGATRVRFHYSAAADGLPILVRGLDEAGAEVSVALATTEGTQWFDHPFFEDAPCPPGTDPEAGWCAWDEVELLSESGAIRSVHMSAQLLGTFLVDDLVVCSTAVEDEEPEPVEPVLELQVDVKPESDGNPVNLRSRGVLPVAILSTVEFDAAELVAESLTLGDGVEDDTPVARKKKGAPHVGFEDVNGDGLVDVVAHFRVQDLVEHGDLTETTTELMVRGTDGGGQEWTGWDSVRVIP